MSCQKPCEIDISASEYLARLVRMRDLTLERDADSDGIHAADDRDRLLGLDQQLELTSVHYKQARDWLLERKAPLRTLDALHLAVAQISDTRLVTSDANLADAAERHGVAVEFFTSHPAARI